MNCDRFKEMIAEGFGGQLSAELNKHMSECSGCQEFYQSLKEIESSIVDDSLFYSDQTDIDKLVSEVDRSIDQLEDQKVTSISPLWKSFVPAAAAIILIVGLGSMTNMFNFGGDTVVTDSSFNNDSILIASAGDNYDTEAYGDILEGYLNESSMVTADYIFEDITEEELNYLEKNFDVGDIL